MLKKFVTATLVLLALAVAVLSGCAPVFAADPAPAATNPAPAALAAFLRDSVFPVIGAFLMGVVSIFLNRLGTKFKIEALTQRDNFLERLAHQGIALAEEKAAQYIGSRGSLTGRDKLDIAVAHVLAYVPKVGEAQARHIVESLLARIPGVGATKALVVLPPGQAPHAGTLGEQIVHLTDPA